MPQFATRSRVWRARSHCCMRSKATSTGPVSTGVSTRICSWVRIKDLSRVCCWSAGRVSVGRRLSVAQQSWSPTFMPSKGTSRVTRVRRAKSSCPFEMVRNTRRRARCRQRTSRRFQRDGCGRSRADLPADLRLSGRAVPMPFAADVAGSATANNAAPITPRAGKRTYCRSDSSGKLVRSFIHPEARLRNVCARVLTWLLPLQPRASAEQS